MKPVFCFGAILAAVSLALPAPIPEDDKLVNPKALVDSINRLHLIKSAQVIESYAYESPENNRFVGTLGFNRTMESIWESLDMFDYFDLFQHEFYMQYLGEKIHTYNIIAQTKEGDPDNVLQLGAHMDSVAEGPGMNDDASGGIALLEIAMQLAGGNFTVNNAVRFSWWSAEEEGLIGSGAYVNELSEDERQKIRLYLNFDMIASPDGEYGVYTSKFEKMGLKAPPGVREAEKLFQDYFDEAGLEHTSVALRGSSDHWPFVLADIPTGGLYAGEDPNYHTARDTVENMDMDLFFNHTKAIAHAVGTYAASFDSLPPREPSHYLN